MRRWRTSRPICCEGTRADPGFPPRAGLRRAMRRRAAENCLGATTAGPPKPSGRRRPDRRPSRSPGVRVPTGGGINGWTIPMRTPRAPAVPGRTRRRCWPPSRPDRVTLPQQRPAAGGHAPGSGAPRLDGASGPLERQSCASRAPVFILIAGRVDKQGLTLGRREREDGPVLPGPAESRCCRLTIQ